MPQRMSTRSMLQILALDHKTPGGVRLRAIELIREIERELRDARAGRAPSSEDTARVDAEISTLIRSELPNKSEE